MSLEQLPPLEIKKATRELAVDNLSQTEDLGTFKNWIGDYKKDILKKQTIQEMKDFLKTKEILQGKTVTWSSVLVFGEQAFVMTDDYDFEQALKTIQADLVAANKEISESKVVKEAEQAEVTAKAKAEQEKLKKELDDKKKSAANGGTGGSNPTDTPDTTKNPPITDPAPKEDRKNEDEKNKDKDNKDKNNKDKDADKNNTDKDNKDNKDKDTDKDTTQKEATSSKSIESMTDEEKVNTLKNAIMSLDRAMSQKQVFIDVTTHQPTVDLTSYEYGLLTQIHQLMDNANNGKKDKWEPYGPDMEKKNMRKTARQLEREIRQEKKKAKSMKKIATLEEELATVKNEKNYYTVTANATHGINEILKTGKYLNTTIDYQPKSELFTNICENLNAVVDNGQTNVAFGTYPNVLVRYSERLEYTRFSNIVNENVRTYSPAEYEACGRNPNILETFFLKNTKMTPEQARRNSTLIATGAVGAALFFGAKWLFGKSKEGEPGFWGKAAMLWGGLLGLNIASQSFTGRWAGDMLKDIRSGKTSFSDLMDWKAWLPKSETGNVTAASYVLWWVTYSDLSKFMKEGSDGSVVMDFEMFEKKIQEKIEIETDPAQKIFRQQKLVWVQSMQTDPKTKDILVRALWQLGIDYKTLTAKENGKLTFDAKAKEYQERFIALNDYKVTGMKLVNEKDPDVKSYLTTGKPTLDELKAATPAKFTRDASADQSTTSLEEQKNIITEPALKNIDVAAATVLQNALNKVNSTIDNTNATNRPQFRYESGNLYLRSYGFDTPVSLLADGNYKIGTLAIPFASADEALKTANLVNFLVVTNRSGWETDAPFYVDNAGDITVGNRQNQPGKILWSEWLGSMTNDLKSKYFNTTAVDGDDYKWLPWMKSTLDSIGGKIVGSTWGANIFVNYLNSFRTSEGSVWNKNTSVPLANYAQLTGGMSWVLKFATVKGKETKDTNTPPIPTPENPASSTPEKKDQRGVSEAFRKSGIENIKASLTKSYIESGIITELKPLNMTADETDTFMNRWANAVQNSTSDFTMDVGSVSKKFVRQTGKHAPQEVK